MPRAGGPVSRLSGPLIAPQNGKKELEEEIGEYVEEYDPWERFNAKTFWFNRKVDRIVLKPVAKVWDKLVPDPTKRSLANALDNVDMPRRLVNNLLPHPPRL